MWLLIFNIAFYTVLLHMGRRDYFRVVSAMLKMRERGCLHYDISNNLLFIIDRWQLSKNLVA